MTAHASGTDMVREMYLEWTADRIRGVQNDTESWGNLTAEPRQVDYIETRAAGVPGLWAIPKGSAEDRVLLCLHGGGFIGGSMYSHRKLFAHLAKAAGTRALVIEDRLPPPKLHPRPGRTGTAPRPRSTTRPPPTDGCSTKESTRPMSPSPATPRAVDSP